MRQKSETGISSPGTKQQICPYKVGVKINDEQSTHFMAAITAVQTACFEVSIQTSLSSKAYLSFLMDRPIYRQGQDSNINQ